MLFCCVAMAQADGGLQVTEAWIREAPPGTTVLAGYLTLSNTGDTPLVIEAVSSPDFNTIEIHRSWIEDGIARMQQVSGLTVPAGGSISLEPGSYHLMLFQPARALSAGDNVTLQLQPSTGSCVTATAPVLRTSETPAHRH
jgi:copper(I)-binding protein